MTSTIPTCDDIAEANRILDSLGWMDNAGDGIREDEAGNTIAFSLVTNTQNSVHENVGTIIQQGLEEIGIKADFRLIEFRDLVSRLTRSYDWEATVIGFGTRTDPPATDWEAEIDCLYVRAG